MKKYFITSLFLLFVTISFAQLQVALGVKGGLNVSNLDVKYAYDVANEGKNYVSKTGFHAGIFASFKISRFVIQPEIIYSQQGANFEYDPRSDEDWFVDLTYLNIPVLVKYSVFQTPLGDIYAQAGAQFSKLQKAETNFYDFDGDGAQSRPKTTDVKDDFENSDMAFVLGAGWDLPFGLIVDVRYNMSTKNLFTYNDYDGEMKNRTLQISVGYKILKFGK